MDENVNSTLIDESTEAAFPPPAPTPQEPIAAQVEERELRYAKFLPGDSLQSFAERYETTVEKIVEDNKINPDFVRFGNSFWV